MNIVITGGHHNSALLVAKALREKGHEIYWFGHKYSMWGDKNPSAEYLEVTKEKIPFIEIKSGKWQIKSHFFGNLIRIPLGFGQSLYWLVKIRPKMIVSFGGYIALPVAISGWLLGIPVVTHEQTTVLGSTNAVISKIAQKIFISFPSSEKLFPGKKLVLTGLPIRPVILSKNKKLFSNSKRTIYVTGGKQGAHVLNEAVFEILPQLVKDFNIIHQCGSSSLYDDYQKALNLKKEISSGDYLVKDYFFEDEIGSVFASADFLITRSGAHITYELALLNKPAIMIPIPWSSRNEQLKNAQTLADLGLAKILNQSNLEKGKLLETINEFNADLNTYKLSDKVKFPTDATEKIVGEIEEILLAKVRP